MLQCGFGECSATVLCHTHTNTHTHTHRQTLRVTLSRCPYRASYRTLTASFGIRQSTQHHVFRVFHPRTFELSARRKFPQSAWHRRVLRRRRTRHRFAPSTIFVVASFYFRKPIHQRITREKKTQRNKRKGRTNNWRRSRAWIPTTIINQGRRQTQTPNSSRREPERGVQFTRNAKYDRFGTCVIWTSWMKGKQTRNSVRCFDTLVWQMDKYK